MESLGVKTDSVSIIVLSSGGLYSQGHWCQPAAHSLQYQLVVIIFFIPIYVREHVVKTTEIAVIHVPLCRKVYKHVYSILPEQPLQERSYSQHVVIFSPHAHHTVILYVENNHMMLTQQIFLHFGKVLLNMLVVYLILLPR